MEATAVTLLKKTKVKENLQSCYKAVKELKKIVERENRLYYTSIID